LLGGSPLPLTQLNYLSTDLSTIDHYSLVNARTCLLCYRACSNSWILELSTDEKHNSRDGDFSL